MGSNPRHTFKRKLIASSVAAVMFGAAQSAVYAADEPEEVVVTGVRASQVSAVNTKREAASVVDSIAAEDIGKLPDATISDSLQRIPGIQIRRSAGEGGSINIRGLPQVTSQLNGEAYLGANSITDPKPDFGDIPSQLFKGADVIKSPTANLLNSGLSGTVNLKTRRPFDFDEGLTGAAAVEGGYGSESQEFDPAANGLISWKNDKVGVLLALTKSESNLANFYEGKYAGEAAATNSGMVKEGSSQGAPYGGTFTGDGGTVDSYYAPEGWQNFNKITERKRDGLNLSFQVDLGEGFQLTSDYFYTKQDQWDRSSGVIAETKWANCCNFNNFKVLQSSEIGGGIKAAPYIDYTPRRVQSYAEVNEFFTKSQDLNFEVKYDNGGPLTGNARFVKGDASKHNINNYFQADLADGGPTNTGVLTDNTKGNRIPGAWVFPNPAGYQGVAQIKIDHRGDVPVWSGFDRPLVDSSGNPLNNGRSLASYMGDLNAYNVAAVSSENNYDLSGALEVKRADLSYKFEDSFVTSVDFGLRASTRDAQKDYWQGVSDFFAGKNGKSRDGSANDAGCQARWKATDVAFGSNTAPNCTVGEFIDGKFVPWTAIGYAALKDYNPIKVTNFGNTEGMPAVWAQDPKALDNVAAFHTKFYGNYSKSQDPGQSYKVSTEDLTGYLQGNFEVDNLSGNLGVRVVSTVLTVKQNIVGPSLDYGMAPLDTGDLITERPYKDILPALNLAYKITDEVKLRAAYSKNMTSLDLDSWGKSLVTSYSLDNGIQHINSVKYDGNPALNPWRSSGGEVSLEWYPTEGSLVSIGYFTMDIDSFPGTDNTPRPFPDLDGVVRNSQVPTSKVINSDGGSLSGLELGGKYSFEGILPGILSHFGVDANITLTDSENKSVKDIDGKHPGLKDNSDFQANFVLWYQDEGLQARIAYNYRSERVQGDKMDIAGTDRSLIEYQDATGYLDASVSYDVVEDWTVYLNASNLTGEYETYYLQSKNQYLGENYYEPRVTLGVRTHF